MNTVLSDEAILIKTKYIADTYSTEFHDAKIIAIEQDAHTRSELAKAVREIKDKFDCSDDEFEGNLPRYSAYVGFENCREAVLKVIERKE